MTALSNRQSGSAMEIECRMHLAVLTWYGFCGLKDRRTDVARA